MMIPFTADMTMTSDFQIEGKRPRRGKRCRLPISGL